MPVYSNGETSTEYTGVCKITLIYYFLTIRVFRIFNVYIDKYNRQFSYDLKGYGGLKAMYMHE